MADTLTTTDDPQQRDISQAESEDRRDQKMDYSAFGEKGGKATQESNNTEPTDKENNSGGLHSHKND